MKQQEFSAPVSEPAHREESAPPLSRALPEGVRRYMERAFGADFSDVRVHEGEKAGSLGAIAYTEGNDLHFSPGTFDPESAEGRRVIAHELAHVLQQRHGRSAQAAAGVNGDAHLEGEAERAADRAARGERIEAVTASHGGGVQRLAHQQFTLGGAPVNGMWSGCTRAIVVRGRLFVRPTIANLANQQLQNALPHGSFVAFQVHTTSHITHLGQNYVELIPKFNLPHVMADPNLAAVALQADQAAVRNQHYWLRTLERINHADDSAHPVADGLNVPMSAPADCESESALLQGLARKGQRHLVYNTPNPVAGGAPIQHNVPAAGDYRAMSPYRNTKLQQPGNRAPAISAAQGLADEFIIETILPFIHDAANAAFLTPFHRALQAGDNAAYFSLAADGIITFNTNKVAANVPDLQYRGVQRCKELYWNLTAPGRAAFDKRHGINDYAAPAVGEAYTMATQDDAPGFIPQPNVHRPGPWTQHWATVVLDLGQDKVTLEGFAQMGRQQQLRTAGTLGATELLQVREARFDMYSGINPATGEPYQPNETFQRKHLATDQHGTHAWSLKVRV